MQNGSTAIRNNIEADLSNQPFAQAAPLYAAMGLTPIPVDEDKKPLVKGLDRFWPGTHRKMLDRFADANVACLSGRDPLPLTVVDIDDPTEIGWCEETLGESPVRVRTPTGGQHWYFRGSGERRKIRIDGGREVDLLGRGGFQVMPPSRTKDGDYTFITGDFDAFTDLPTLKADTQAQSLVGMREGDGRNPALFRKLLPAASNAESRTELELMAGAYNQEFDEPLPENEVLYIAASVWRYKENGTLMLPGCEAQVMLSSSELDAFSGNFSAMFLYAQLRRSRGHNGTKPFVLPTEYGRKLAGFGSRQKYRRVRDFLFDNNLLVSVQRGKSGSRQATIVRFPY